MITGSLIALKWEELAINPPAFHYFVHDSGIRYLDIACSAGNMALKS
jgi:hypothetical protein